MSSLPSKAHRLFNRITGWDTASRLLAHAQSQPRFSPGIRRFDGLELAYTDALSLYVEYKDIFGQRIYHFDSTNRSPRIIDGGGCIGMSTLYFKKIYPQSRIVCFEPDPDLASVLKRNLLTNEIQGVELVEAGLGAEEGEVSFEADGVDGGRVTDVAQGNKRIRLVRLSQWLNQSVDFLKLNIEGQELAVLEEVEKAGRIAQVQQMVIEYHGWAGGPQLLGPILDLLNRNSFRYLVHDFDRISNPATKPPFHLPEKTPWFCLVYASRMEDTRKETARQTND